MKKCWLISIYMLICWPILAQNDYQIFNSKGKKISTNNLLEEISQHKLIFFGELHQDSISHAWERKILSHLLKTNDSLSLGMEMLERDDQLIVNEYLQGLITETHFKEEAKWWSNFKHDYLPLVDSMRKYNKNVIASNIPRRYASIVYRFGIEYLDSLPSDASHLMCPLPFKYDTTSLQFQELKKMGLKGHHFKNLYLAQCIKDATMANSIAKLIHTNHTIFHISGAFHIKWKEGILFYLNENIETISISMVEQQKINKLEKANFKIADYIIVKNVTE